MANETKNVKISLDDRIQTQLAGSYSIHWEDTDFKSEPVQEWLEPRLLGFTPAPSRNGSRSEQWTLSVNCYAKTGRGQKNALRVWELADAVWAAFNQATVAVKNWAAEGDPVIFYIRFGEAVISRVPGTGARPKATGPLSQLNVSVPAWIFT